MVLFWEQGYEETSLTDLQRTMRLRPSSIYAAFGGKQRLYREALNQYLAGSGSFLRRTLQRKIPVNAILRTLLEAAAREMTRPGQPAGCMLSLAVVHGGPRSKALRAGVSKMRATSRELIRLRLEQAVRDGELPRATDSAALARFFMTILQGMSVQARDGATHRELLAVTGAALKVLSGG
jgi:AcrR family transcriptional regulator